MSVKELIRRAKPVKEKSAALSKDGLKTLLDYTVHFALAFVLARAQLIENAAPLSAALVSATGIGIYGIITYLGTCIGVLTAMPFIYALKYVCLGLLIYSSNFVFRDSDLVRKPMFAPLSTLVMSACVGFVYVTDAGFTPESVRAFAAECALISASSYILRSTLVPGRVYRDNIRSLGVFMLIGGICCALTRVSIFDALSVGRALSAAVIFITVYKGGAVFGLISAVTLGVMADLSLGEGVYFSFIYPLCALVGSFFCGRNRLRFALSMIFADVFAVLAAFEFRPSSVSIYEFFIASVVFILLPSSAAAKLSALFPSEVSGYGVTLARDYSRARVEQTAALMRDIGTSLTKEVSLDSLLSAEKIFDASCEDICRECAFFSRCWELNKDETVSLFSSLEGRLFDGKELDASSFPDSFSEKCPKLDELTASVNERLRARKYRRQYLARLSDTRKSLSGLYSAFGELFSSIEEQLGRGITFEPGLERRLRRYLASLDIDARTAVFRSGGRLHAELSAPSLGRLTRDPQYLNKLSEVLGERLCTDNSANSASLISVMSAEPWRVTFGSACASKDGETVCGDSDGCVKNSSGLLSIILSDGMGTGSDAAKSSVFAVDTLQKLLRIGMTPADAISLLSCNMFLSGDASPSFATVDLISIDLFSAETSIYKFGSAPTYIRRGGKVRRILSRSLAAGLSVDGKSGPVNMKLSDGSLIVAVSDGIISSGCDDWLVSLITEYSGTDMNTLAHEIVEKASSLSGCGDDATCIAALFSERE